jgi:enoyl-CoA hydratase/carnithine racemase
MLAGMDITLTRDGAVAVLTWNAGENRINLDSLARINHILDELETLEGPLALVLTGTGKFFCNGLDLERFGSSPDELGATLSELNRTIGRLMLYPAYTVAALNGHTFAGGALLSCAFDFRVMREDRGYWCMNEAEIGLPLNEQLLSILIHRLPRATAVDAMLRAHRFDGPEALARGIVEATAGELDVVNRAVEVALAMAEMDRETLRTHKRLAHAQQAEHLGFMG